MALSAVRAPHLSGISTCVPEQRFDNLRDTSDHQREHVRKVVAMAGVSERRVVAPGTCSTDLCFAAASQLLGGLEWDPASVDALIMVTQTPDYIMPSSSCLLQTRLHLSRSCAAFDVGLGCSGYVYGLWLASMMLDSGGLKRVLLLHGETPSLYAADGDQAVALLFGDAGSATALESSTERAAHWFFALRSDGTGADDLIIKGGGFRDRFPSESREHYVRMNGGNVFNFTIKEIPPLIDETLRFANMAADAIDFYIFHQSNRFIINHLLHKCAIPAAKAPLILGEFGNCGGPSIPLAITKGLPADSRRTPLNLMLLGYGVGLSWGAAVVGLSPSIALYHSELATAST
jgi:3-oxoacyl-[acyl-carrier-protein] synthase-3